MKKRIISLLMVALMLVSLVPMGALAAGNTTITKQPSNKSAAVGETVTFEIAATNPNSTDLEYLWFDADKVNIDDIDLSKINQSKIMLSINIVKFKAVEIEGVKTDKGKTLTVTADKDMNICCAVFYKETEPNSNVPVYKDLALSNTVTLTVTGGTVDPDPFACKHENLDHQPNTDGTCDPHIEYWYCPDCNSYFTDAACTKQTTKAKLDNGLTKDETKHTDLKHFPSKAATCTEKGNIEYWYCSGCKEYYSDAAGTVKTTSVKVSTSKNDHDYYWVADEVAGVHYQKCRVCGTTTGTSSHSGGTASCKTQAKCAKCGVSYGELDPNTHVNFELRNEVKATETTQGYTGDKYCKDCGVFIEKGSYYSAQCAGGCKDIELVKGTPKTCTEDGTIDYYRCKKCGNMYKDERASILITKDDLVDKCTGHDLHPGTDALNLSKDNLKQFANKNLGLSIVQIVQMIRDGTFDLDHIIGMIKIKDIDHCSDDTYHWLGCQRCGKTLEDLRDELNSAGFEINEKWYELSRKTAHTGGTATCTEKAVCDECGDAYGELGAHRYDAVVTAPTCTQNGYTKHTCSSCKDSYTDNETVKTGHIIKYGVCEKCNMRFSNPFYDVNGTDWFYSAVMWAYYNTPQVTNGKDESHFAPKASCTRAQVVTFLWRAAGRPEPSGSVQQFSDVPKTNSYAYCYDAILWAVENGITKGTDATHFSPNATVTRAQFVTFLWRYAGEPAPKNMSCGFNDVDANAFYYKAVLWAVENGVTTGKTATQFAPGATCTRCEVAAFMFRAFSKGITAK